MRPKGQFVSDHIPTSEVLEIHLAESKQLFNAIDPAPFREKDLDPKAEQFIVDWARELPANAPLSLVVLLDRPAGPRGHSDHRALKIRSEPEARN